MDRRTELAHDLARAGASFYQRGWMLGTAGNLSARLDDRHYLVSASGGHKGQLGPEDFIVFELGMLAPDRPSKPSAETVVHDRLYATTDAGAVLHVHGPRVTLVSRMYAGAGRVDVSGWEYVKGLGFWDEGARVELPIVPNHHHIPDLADAVAAAAGGAPCVLVDGHGIYAWGADVASAQRHIECAEFLCDLVWEMGRRQAD